MRLNFLALLICPFLLKSMTAPHNNICYLAYLPKDIHNLIAENLSFKDRETDTEFIKRTKRKPKIPNDFLKDDYIRDFECKSNFMVYSEAAHSADFSKSIALFSLTENRKMYAIILDRKMNTKEIDKRLADLVNNEQNHWGLIGSVAISSDGNWVGIVANKVAVDWATHYFNPQPLYKIRIMVIHRFSDNRHYFEIPPRLDGAFLLDFNKQNTKIIAHGGDKNNHYYVIYQLPSDFKHELISKKTLDEYFRQQCICKNIKNSL